MNSVGGTHQNLWQFGAVVGNKRDFLHFEKPVLALARLDAPSPLGFALTDRIINLFVLGVITLD